MSLELLSQAQDLPRCRDGHVDFRQWEAQSVVQYFDEVTASGDILLHGSQTATHRLDPMPAFDLYREDGRRTAVYATENGPTALSCAVYNRLLARQSVASKQGGMHIMAVRPQGSQVCEFIFLPHVFKDISANADTPFLADGFVIAIDRHQNDFSRDPSNSTDWFSEHSIQIALTYRIPRSVGGLLFGNLTQRFKTRAYTVEELAERRTIVEQHGQLFYPDSPALSLWRQAQV